MAFPITVAFRGMNPSPTLRSALEMRAGMLRRAFAGITRCAVTIEAGAPFEGVHQVHVRICVAVPRQVISVSWPCPVGIGHREFPDVRGAFEEADRLLRHYAALELASAEARKSA